MTFQQKRQLWITSLIGLIAYIFIDHGVIWGFIFLLPTSLFFLLRKQYRFAFGGILFFGLICIDGWIPVLRIGIAVYLIYAGFRFMDDHDMIRIGLTSFLQDESEIKIVGEARDGEEAVEKVRETRPDVILMDVKMANMDGIQATEIIQRLYPNRKIIVLTSYEDEIQARKILQAGAFSYLLKTSHPTKILQAIYQAAKGESIIDESVAGKIFHRSLDSDLPHCSLTARELDILKAMAQGKSNQEIAAEFYISLATVKYHITNLLGKLQVKDRTQAVIYAYRHHLFDDI